MIMKELIDLIRPSSVIQLRSSNAYFRHTMPDIDRQWSLTAPLCSLFRQMHHLPMSSLHDQYDYHLLFTPVRQHNPHGKSSLTRQSCLWAYFSQLETKDFRMKALIDYSDRVEIFSFEQLAIGLLHRQIEVKHFLQVLNASIVALCRIPTEMVNLVHSSPAKKRKGSNLLAVKGNDETLAGVMNNSNDYLLFRAHRSRDRCFPF